MLNSERVAVNHVTCMGRKFESPIGKQANTGLLRQFAKLFCVKAVKVRFLCFPHAGKTNSEQDPGLRTDRSNQWFGRFYAAMLPMFRH